MRVAVVGHVEWVDLVRVGRLPAAGEIVHAGAAWSGPAGGGAVAAVQLRRLAGAATLFTALGADELGWRARAELEALGVRVVAAVRPEPQRRALVHVSADGERTITVVGERMGPRVNDRLPWGELAACDAVYVTAGDAGAIRAARAATVLVATPRALATLAGAGAELDALVGSGSDPGERYRRGDLARPPRLVVRTAGAGGGEVEHADGSRERFAATALPGPLADTYGCGDSFAAGLTFALGAGRPLARALEVAARCGAACATGRGPYAAQLSCAS